MPKLLESKSENPKYYVFHCPGCECGHSIYTKGEGVQHWQFDGNMDKPTISPSILVRMPYKDEMRICHSFVENGMIRFLNDCTHKLKGQTVELPEI